MSPAAKSSDGLTETKIESIVDRGTQRKAKQDFVK